MPKNLKKYKRSSMKNLSPNYTFSAPPWDVYGAFQPGAYYRMYHRIEAEKMKRSYDWLRFTSITERDYIDIINRMIQDNILPVNTYMEEGILNVENRELDYKLGDDANTKIVYFDLEDIEVK
ncbi:MAG: hypothetical protein ACW98X_09545 [Promethearchaeota archaeon]|jgi:hypothetical protein